MCSSLHEVESNEPMTYFFRVVGAMVAGIVVSFALVVAVEAFSAVAHPFPPAFEGTHEEICEHVANYPQWVLAVVVPMWACTAFIGTWISGRLGNRLAAIVVGGLLLAAAIFNIAMLPYPLWFALVQPIAILAAVALGFQWSCGRKAVAPNP